MYETPHSLLDNISMGYRQVFLPHPSLSLSTYDILFNVFLTQAFGDHLSARLTKLKVRRESEANVEEAGGSK